MYNMTTVPAKTFITAAKHRSNCAEALYEKGFLKKICNILKTFMTEHLVNEVAGLQPVTLLKTRL